MHISNGVTEIRELTSVHYVTVYETQRLHTDISMCSLHTAYVHSINCVGVFLRTFPVRKCSTDTHQNCYRGGSASSLLSEKLSSVS